MESGIEMLNLSSSVGLSVDVSPEV